MKRTEYAEITWVQLEWQRLFEHQAVIDLLTHIASQFPHISAIFEARGYQGEVKYYLGSDRKYINILKRTMQAHGNIRFREVTQSARIRVNESAQLKITKPALSLNTDITEAVTRAGLAALLQPKGQEQSVLQVILGTPYSPSPTPGYIPDPHASWVKMAFGNVEQATSEAKTAVKEKISTHGFAAVIRLGATGTKKTAQGHILSLLSALRTLRSAGVTIQASAENPDKLNFAHIPWHFPLRLSVKELANFLMFPAGDAELPGIAPMHPKLIMPPSWYQNPFAVHDRTFAMSADKRAKLSISPRDSLEHAVILGPTGSGKSTAMQRLILSDIYAGRSVLVIDPKADLVNSILARIPKHRENDVVVIDPSSENPVGLNPLAYKNHHNPGLIADAILSVFQQLFVENWGIRSQDHIGAGLLTLIKAKDSSLLWLPTMLTD